MTEGKSELTSWVAAVIFWMAILAAFFGGVTLVELSKISRGQTAVRCQ